jgi:gliding motility-associated-like protein
VTVNPIVAPAFAFGNAITLCAGDPAPLLATTSDNGITGTWNVPAIDNQNTASYTFTPSAGQCATAFNLQVTVTPLTLSTFSFGNALTICAGTAVPALPVTSANGITGTWSPTAVDNQNSGVYTFTPDPAPGQCRVNFVFTVTVNPIQTPAFTFGNTLSVCSGAAAPSLPTTSSNGITGTWSPSLINNQSPATYTFTPAAGQCASGPVTLAVSIRPTPAVNAEEDITITDGTVVPANSFSGSPAGVGFSWVNSNTSVGLAGSGVDEVPSFTAANTGAAPITATINITPVLNGCNGASQNYKITVTPLNKDVFVPNVFTPNGDGKNEVLLVYGNYITKLDMRVFNQWGEQLFATDTKSKGWDGTHKGKPQPTGVYVYVLEASLTDGRTVKSKGYINLMR